MNGSNKSVKCNAKLANQMQLIPCDTKQSDHAARAEQASFEANESSPGDVFEHAQEHLGTEIHEKGKYICSGALEEHSQIDTVKPLSLLSPQSENVTILRRNLAGGAGCQMISKLPRPVSTGLSSVVARLQPCSEFQLDKRKAVHTPGTGSPVFPKPTAVVDWLKSTRFPKVSAEPHVRPRGSTVNSPSSRPARPLSTTLPPILSIDGADVASRAGGSLGALRACSADCRRGRQAARGWPPERPDTCDSDGWEEALRPPPATSNWSLIDVNDNTRLLVEQCAATLLEHQFRGKPKKDLIVFEERLTCTVGQDQKNPSLPHVPKSRRPGEVAASCRSPKKSCIIPPSLGRDATSSLQTDVRLAGPGSRQGHNAGPVSPQKRDTGPVSPQRRGTGTGSPKRRDAGPVSPQRRDTGHVSPQRRDAGPGSSKRPDVGPVSPQKRDTGPVSPHRRGTGTSSPQRRDAVPDSSGRRVAGFSSLGRPVASGRPVDYRPNLSPYPRQYILLGLLGPDPYRVKQRQDKMRRRHEYVERLARLNRAAALRRTVVPLRVCSARAQSPSPKFAIPRTGSMECRASEESSRESPSAGLRVSGETADCDGTDSVSTLSRVGSDSTLDWGPAESEMPTWETETPAGKVETSTAETETPTVKAGTPTEKAATPTGESEVLTTDSDTPKTELEEMLASESEAPIEESEFPTAGSGSLTAEPAADTVRTEPGTPERGLMWFEFGPPRAEPETPFAAPEQTESSPTARRSRSDTTVILRRHPDSDSDSDSDADMADAPAAPVATLQPRSPPPPDGRPGAGGGGGGELPARSSSEDVFFELHEQVAVRVTAARCRGGAGCACGVLTRRPEVSRSTQAPHGASFVYKNLLVMDLEPAEGAAGAAARRRRPTARLRLTGVGEEAAGWRRRGGGRWSDEALWAAERPPGDWRGGEDVPAVGEM